MKLDKNDAPKGAIAVEATSICDDCMYFSDSGGCSKPGGVCYCTYLQRRDGHDVIFKPAPKSYNRDAHGRFTSAQSDARKQLIDKAQFPAFAESVKAMTGETITQAISKKQAEIERNGKQSTYTQTNGEKYASKSVELTLFRAKEDLSATFATVSEFVRWLNQPAAQDWPEWCKVGAWIANCSRKEPIFRKIESISASQLHFADGWNAEFEHVSKNYKPARVRQFTAKEAVDFVGKTITEESTGEVWIVIYVKVSATCPTLICTDNGVKISLQTLAEHYILPDGKPCGVLEVVE